MTFDGATVLVTGGADFIGSELVRQLEKQAGKIIVVDNLINGRRENIEEVLNEQVRLHATEICDIESMNGLLKYVEVVFHLACQGVRHSIHLPRNNHDVNATATLDLLEIARIFCVQCFVYISSSEIYGTTQ